jgi:hypothetical protein
MKNMKQVVFMLDDSTYFSKFLVSVYFFSVTLTGEVTVWVRL